MKTYDRTETSRGTYWIDGPKSHPGTGSHAGFYGAPSTYFDIVKDGSPIDEYPTLKAARLRLAKIVAESKKSSDVTISMGRAVK